MNGITVNVPRDTVLEFFYTKDVGRASRKVALAITSKRVVEFKIGGLMFRTKAEIVEEFPETLFAVKLSEQNCISSSSSSMKRDSVVTVDLATFESPELFPLVFDFLLRCYKFRYGRQTTTKTATSSTTTTTTALSNNNSDEAFPPPALRVVRLNQRQSKLLDEIEKRVFGIEQQQQCELCVEANTVEITGSRYYYHTDSEKGIVCVAIPPPGVEVPHSMCIDPLVVRLVLLENRQVVLVGGEPVPHQKKAKPSSTTTTTTTTTAAAENQALIIISTLRRRYPTILNDNEPADSSYFRHWGVVDIPRGEPFVLRRDGDELVVDFLVAGEDVLVA